MSRLQLDKVSDWVQVQVLCKPVHDELLAVILYKDQDEIVLGRPANSINFRLFDSSRHLFSKCFVGDIVLITGTMQVPRLKLHGDSQVQILHRLVSSKRFDYSCSIEYLQPLRELIQWANLQPIIRFEIERNVESD